MTEALGRRIVGGALAAVGFLLLAVWLLSVEDVGEGGFPTGYMFLMFTFLVGGLLLALAPSPLPPADEGGRVAAPQSVTAPMGPGVLVCGKALSQGRLCVREPGHGGRCSAHRPAATIAP